MCNPIKDIDKTFFIQLFLWLSSREAHKILSLGYSYTV